MRALLLSGGGLKGAFQVPVIEGLLGRNHYDAIYGISVGSLNGALAAQGDLDALRALWAGIDDAHPADGISGFLAPVFPTKGLYSLRPCAAQIKKLVAPHRLKTVYGAGVTVRQLGEYRLLRFDTTSKADDLHDAMLGSSAIAGLMEPWPAAVGGRHVLLSDGGHVHAVPPPPVDATEIDVVLCNPIHRKHFATSEVDGLAEAVVWAIEVALEAAQEGDLTILRELRARGVSVTIYAPRDTFGGLLKADAATIHSRIVEGRWALDNPHVL